jgi:hypothetical protein
MKTIGFPLPISPTLIPTPLTPLILILNYASLLSFMVVIELINSSSDNGA